MATRKEKLQFTLRRFKGFWKQFRRSRRGIAGVSIVVFFTILALTASIVITYDPLIPQEGTGTYPGLPGGRKIAEKLCVPTWYKYIPWVPKGQTVIEEKFYNVVVKYYGVYWQLFASIDKANATDNVLRLTRRVASLEKVTATFLNGTTYTLASDEWSVVASRPREISIRDVYPNQTIFTVKYITGIDITENTKIISDHTFATLNSVNIFTNDTNLPNTITLSYNNEKGYTTKLTKESGCIEVAYNPTETQSKIPEATISVPFVYAYNEPPRSIFIHYSARVEGDLQVQMSFIFVRETPSGQETYVLSNKILAPSVTWKSEQILSTQKEVLDNIGVSPVTDKIFPTLSNYTFSVKITFPNSTQNARVYLDNLDCVLYGNAFGLLGTDNGGGLGGPYPRDLASALIYGTRVSLFIGVVAAVLSTLIGLFLGLISGYVGGIVDEGLMRFADLLLVLPTLPLFIVLIMALKQFGAVSMWNIIILITFFGWMSFARSVRSMVLSLRERSFIEAARAVGAGKMYIINRHILPNVFALVYITLATSVPSAIVLEASLSWLGLGDPRVASWGKILYDFNASGIAVTKGLTDYWFWIFPACISIALLAAAFILIGYALDEILNPRLRERR